MIGGKQLIVYDLDGTLVDTLQDVVAAVNQTLTRLGHRPLPVEQIRQAIGRGLVDLLGRCLGTQDQAELANGVQIFRSYYADHLVDHSHLYPHAQALLAYFHARPQAVVTNKPNPFAANLLSALGVADYFFRVVAAGDGYPKKPDPAAVITLLRETDSSAHRCLLIGDSALDVETGRRAGVFTVGVTHGFADQGELESARPDLLVHDFAELLAIARQRQW